MSQPTVLRMENTPGLRDLIRLGRVLVDVYCASYIVPPAVITLNIYDACDVVHGQQQLWDCQEFRVGAAIVDPKEVPDGTTQSTPHC